MKLFITEAEVDLYAKLSKDENPIHLNQSVAQAHGFKDRIVHGMLVVSLAMQKIRKTNFVKVKHKFIKPVYINQVYQVKVDDYDSFITLKIENELHEVKVMSKLYLKER